ncbi:Glu/Leu/Phe/Val dehydrogenase [Patescibacteria group bacterium]
MPNAFENALIQLERANKVQPFSEEFLVQLRTPDKELHFEIPLQMDDGSIKVLEGYRVQHNNARGPFKGGIRFHQDTDIHEVRALAFWMSLKTAAVNIPMGGGKGGVTVNPKELSETEKERLARGWVKAIVDDIGPKKDVPAPDVNTTPQIMAWMADEYGKLTGDTSGAMFTGKPLDKGGSEGRGQATAQGGFYVFETLREKLGLPLQCRVVIQGFGNAGRIAAEIWTQAGHKVVAVSDSRGAVHNAEGLDVAAVGKHKDETRSVVGAPGAMSISDQELLALECDLLIPAALEHVITQDNADSVKAKAVLELANGPTVPEADDILFEKGITVIPDIVANAGGVTVSMFEWQQNLAGEHWSESEVLDKLRPLMESAASDIYEKAQILNTDLRRAAFIIALERIEQALKTA